MSWGIILIILGVVYIGAGAWMMARGRITVGENRSAEVSGPPAHFIASAQLISGVVALVVGSMAQLGGIVTQSSAALVVWVSVGVQVMLGIMAVFMAGKSSQGSL